ncbi:glucose-1-phosphate adenylyltransferase [Phragmitibacter flavus]|uniref:Glucose-1-phosphate adenylyltransferase n=1 Tax=Phragmitibacter flavus TaxID=2576071 RepID=A0A5R8KJC9_9BACT|nr:glucose-1-phosphate adenylyltransferase [Phragmitibacter flavus]TLD72392.1 glucose-1-phosphate adenylyltransferase [Phragmitibacter flavus]
MAAPISNIESESLLTRQTLGIIMGGGAGTRLFPLTKDRAKPAVPLAGKYRLVDIPISNCINSGLQQVYVLTQYNSTSLNRHIARTYKFDTFTQGFVEILAAQQTSDGTAWYQGTADAVRQNLRNFLSGNYEYFLILSGDQLYRMDFRKLMASHLEAKADITIATIPVDAERASSFGIMETDKNNKISNFVEKPKDPAVLAKLAIPEEAMIELGLPLDQPAFQANMGIYVFNRKVLLEALDNTYADFGKHIIPAAISKYCVQAFPFQGYWEDIGTIRSFFEANLDLCSVVPQYDFFDSQAPIYTHARFLPATKINGGVIRQTLLSDGCILSEAVIERAILGIRTVVEAGSSIRNCIIMGADYYAGAENAPSDSPPPGIGKGCKIEHAIIDKNVHIGDNVVITPKDKPDDFDSPDGMYYIRDGIVVLPKGAVVPSGTWI